MVDIECFNLNSASDENAHFIDGKPSNKGKTECLSGHKVIFFSYSTQLSTKFQVLIKTKMKKFLALSLSGVVFIMLINVKMPIIGNNKEKIQIFQEIKRFKQIVKSL